MSLFDRLNSDSRDEQATETVSRDEQVSLPCKHSDAIEQAEQALREGYDVDHIKRVKAYRYTRYWDVSVTAVVREDHD